MSGASDPRSEAADEHPTVTPAGLGDDHASGNAVGAANSADPFADLLALLGKKKRQGLVGLLSARYYQGWRPGRNEDQFSRQVVASDDRDERP